MADKVKEDKEKMESQSNEETNNNINEEENVSNNDENNSIENEEIENNGQETVNESNEMARQIDQLEETIIRLEAEKESLSNRFQRLQADFSNYRKRTDKEMGKIQSRVIVEIIRELLPILDNFERALSQGDNDNDFNKGVEMIYRQIHNFLEKQGVEMIDSVGEHFNHNYHNAVIQVDSDEYESGVVVEELQKGYILGDTVIRPAMVKVAE
ncbi:MAG: nucleotide exchange factor GrpE [Bacillota bacterium]